jgi:hypothetical protein
VFAPYGVGDGSTTFGIPNRAYVGVGRDNASGSASNINQVSTTLTLVSGSATGTVGSAAGLAVGMFVAHPKVAYGTRITAISGTTITMEHNATGSVTGSAARFSPIVDAQTLGVAGGGLTTSTTLVTGNLPAYTPSGSVGVSVSGTFPGIVTSGFQGGTGGVGYTTGGSTAISASGSGSFSGSAQGGTSAPIVRPNVQPTIVMNYIIKR